MKHEINNPHSLKTLIREFSNQDTLEYIQGLIKSSLEVGFMEGVQGLPLYEAKQDIMINRLIQSLMVAMKNELKEKRA